MFPAPALLQLVFLPVVLAALLATPGAGSAAAAASVWTGPSISFTKADFADPTLPENQDQLTSGVSITRGDLQGIYNIVTELNFDFGTSPEDTEWAWDLAGFNSGESVVASNYANLTFNDWYNAHGANPLGTLSIPGVLHLISEDIYLDISFTSWTSGRGATGGGFSYIRSTANVPEPDTALLLAAGLAAISASRVRPGSPGREVPYPPARP